MCQASFKVIGFISYGKQGDNSHGIGPGKLCLKGIETILFIFENAKDYNKI
jgi:hypothetical protein